MRIKTEGIYHGSDEILSVFLLVIYLKVFEKIRKYKEKVESYCRILYYES